MKIVQINAVNRFSSTGANTWELHKYLISKGHNSYIFCTNEHNPQEGIYKIGNNFDRKIHSLLSHVFGNQGSYSILVTYKLIKQLKALKPDVVHLGNLHSNFINLSLLFRFLSKQQIPTTITLHDCWFFTGQCCYFTDTNCNNWKTGCGNCPDLHNWNRSWFFDNTKNNLRHKSELFRKISKLGVIGVSKWVTSFIPNSILRDAKIVSTIYNWIDTDIFKPKAPTRLRKKINLNSDDFVVLGVAQNWNHQKGINAFIELSQRMPYCKFVLVGNIDSSIALTDNIIATGATSRVDELVEYYSLADVFFMPSIRETFGKVTAEALCCGTPVVAYNVTATPELISPDCGFIIEQGDLDAAENKINIIRAKGKRHYTKSCRSFGESIFDKNILMGKYLDIFKELQ